MVKKKKYNASLKPYVNDILVFEEKNQNSTTKLPFFADGFPGIVFCNSMGGLFHQPKNKKLSELFLYGQTIEPIQLFVSGAYKMIILQLYPFATKILLGIEPKELNDECYDLMQLWKSINKEDFHNLRITENTSDQIEKFSNFLSTLADKSSLKTDNSILLAINLILQFKGQITIKELTNKLFITERTLERRFIKDIGVTPKTFCKIIQFQNSLHQISTSENSKMMDAVYENGFSDQSHFIRTFKKYTGITPSEFQNLPELANF